ncbi:MAG: tetratricopeptide repeat protein [Saprospirales bacterium]|jgi:tetratricopeptide (TPR) repeat protein|nr:tetratricopeptide repeat protein [Saprospirales bacterium]
MSVKKKQKQPAFAPVPQPYRLWLWLVIFAGALFLIPQCLDRYLVPRFFFVSLVLLAAVSHFRKPWQTGGDWRLHGFDLLLLAWYGLNLASVFWAFRWSEGIFYAQKVLILFAVYWLLRQAFHYDEGQQRHTLLRITQVLTLVVSVLLLIQVGMAYAEHGLDNQHLYDYASGVFGNKGLASDFLFFLLVLNVLFQGDFKNKWFLGASVAVLLALILLLQTRTVYLAVGAGIFFYFPGRAVLEPAFRPFFFKRLLPGGLLALALLVALVSWKGQGSSLAERLNPTTYLESASAVERRIVWYKTDLLNKERPWWGAGAGSWKILFPSQSIEGAFRLQEKNIVFTRVHNDYLEVRAEMGLVGVSLFIALFAGAFLAAVWALRRLAAPQARHDLLVWTTGLLGYCVIQYFDFPRERIELQVILALLFAGMAHRSAAVWAALPGLPARRFSAWFAGLLAAGLAFNAWIGWQRIQGEIHNVRALRAQASGNYAALQREAAAARNPFYEYNDVALPLQWYEGIAFYQMNRVPESVAAFEAAYRLNPWAFQVLNNYGTALVRTGQYQPAIALFEKALKINPKYDEGKLNISYSWYALGQYEQALEWLNRVDTIPNPGSPDERAKNQAVLQQKASLENVIQQQISKQ